MDDLDENAIQLAREGYRQRFPDYEEEMQTWSNDVFLDKVGLTQDGQITRAAMLLVGKQEKAYKLPHIAQMDWKSYRVVKGAWQIDTARYRFTPLACFV